MNPQTVRTPSGFRGVLYKMVLYRFAITVLVVLTACPWLGAEPPAERPVPAEAPVAENPSLNTEPSETRRPAGDGAGETSPDPLFGLTSLSSDKAPSQRDARVGFCWLAAYWLGIGIGRWHRHPGARSPLLACAFAVGLGHLANGLGQTIAGVLTIIYGFVFAASATWFGGRTGRFLLIWSGFLAGATAMVAGTRELDGQATIGTMAFLPCIVHLILSISLGWMLVLVGTIKRSVTGSRQDLLRAAGRFADQAEIPGKQQFGGCLNNLGPFILVLAGIHLIDLASGIPRLLKMVSAPVISFGELRGDPPAAKFLRVKGCPLALPESSFEVVFDNGPDGGSSGAVTALSRLLVPMAELVEGKPGSSSLLLSTTRKRWRQMYIRGFSPKVDLGENRFTFRPREMVRYDGFIQEQNSEFYPVEDLLVETPERPTDRWSTEPIRVPLLHSLPDGPGSEVFDRPRPAGLLEPFRELIDRGPEVYDTLLDWSLTLSLIAGCLIWLIDPELRADARR